MTPPRPSIQLPLGRRRASCTFSPQNPPPPGPPSPSPPLTLAPPFPRPPSPWTPLTLAPPFPRPPSPWTPLTLAPPYPRPPLTLAPPHPRHPSPLTPRLLPRRPRRILVIPAPHSPGACPRQKPAPYPDTKPATQRRGAHHRHSRQKPAPYPDTGVRVTPPSTVDTTRLGRRRASCTFSPHPLSPGPPPPSRQPRRATRHAPPSLLCK